MLAVPQNIHAAMAIDAMKKANMYLLKNPLAMNEAEATLMIETAKKTKFS